MKRIFLLCILVILMTGCTSIKNRDINDIITDTISSKVNTTNVNRNGYRYYLPKGLNLKNSKSFNEVLESELYQYYLYVDIVSYHNNTQFNYTENKNAYFSKNISYNGKKGYIEINNYKNNQYLIEIMYNYAKIEVVVYDKDINVALAYAMVVLNSVTYNDNVIKSYLSSSTLDGKEEEFDIFEIVGSDNYLQITEDTSSGETKKDPDYVN